MMKKAHAIARVVLAAALAAGCGGVKPGRRPEATFEAARRAILEDRYEGLWALLAERSRNDEAARIAALQRQIASELPNMTDSHKERFLRENGIMPDEFVNLSPAEAFAAQVRNTARLAATLRRALSGARVAETKLGDRSATLKIEMPGEPPGELTLVLENGLWRIPDVNDLFKAVRLQERSREPGRTPQETYDAFVACLADGAYADVWGLLASENRERLAESFKRSQEEVRGLDGGPRRDFERRYGVTAEEFVAMEPRDVLALELRRQLSDPIQRQMLLSRRVESVEVNGPVAVLVLLGPAGRNRMRMAFEGERWFIAEF